MLTLALFATILVVNSQPLFGPVPGGCTTTYPADNCPCEYAKCTWWGDPHTTTFDGLYHGFQGVSGGRYRYVSPCISDFQRVPFQVLSTHQNCGGPITPFGFTCPQNTDIRLYDAAGNYVSTLRLRSWSIVQQYTEPALPSGASLPDGFYSYANGYFTIRRYLWWVEVSVFTNQLCPTNSWTFSNPPRPDIVVRMTNWARRVEVQLNEYYQRAVCGLCGYYSGYGNTADDFRVSQDWTIFGFPIPLCFQFLTTGLPTWVTSYNIFHWWVVNWFGWFWQDFGTNVRRLQEGTTPRYDEPKAGAFPPGFQYEYSDDQLPNTRARNQVPVDAVVAECQRRRQEQQGVELDCNAIANEANIRCSDPDPEGCFRQFCIDGCGGEGCQQICDVPQNPDGTGNFNDFTTRGG